MRLDLQVSPYHVHRSSRLRFVYRFVFGGGRRGGKLFQRRQLDDGRVADGVMQQRVGPMGGHPFVVCPIASQRTVLTIVASWNSSVGEISGRVAPARSGAVLEQQFSDDARMHAVSPIEVNAVVIDESFLAA